MQINKLVFGVLVLGCLGAAGIGGYMANRPATTPASATVATPDTTSAAQPVTASEGVVAPEPAAAAPATPTAPPSIWPADATRLEVSTTGDPTAPSARGSTCKAGAARHTLDVATRQLGWEACDHRVMQPQQLATGARTLTDAELAEVFAALDALGRADAPACPADAAQLRLVVTTPAGARTYDDAQSACPADGVDAHLTGVPSVLDLLHRLGHHAQAEADCAAGKPEACTAAGWHHHAIFRDEAAAIPLLDKACQGGDLLTCTEYALFDIEGDGKKKVAAIERACDAKIAAACTVLGHVHDQGWWGLKPNKAKAKAAYAKACAAGDADRCPAKK
jgi:TPR repeat protein